MSERAEVHCFDADPILVTKSAGEIRGVASAFCSATDANFKDAFVALQKALAAPLIPPVREYRSARHDAPSAL